MPQFLDKKGQSWNVNLDPVIALEIKEDHGIELTNLESDPLLKLRVDPMILASTISVICRDQMTERNMSPMDLMKVLPQPPDEMLKAISEAITSFFPTGRHSHVAEVLAAYEKMGVETDELTTAKLTKLVSDPATKKMLSDVADRKISEAMTTLRQTNLPPITSSTADEIASS